MYLLFPSVLLLGGKKSGLAPNRLFNLTAILFVPVSAALLRVSHGSQSGLTSQNGNHGNAGRGLPVAALAADAPRRALEMVLWAR